MLLQQIAATINHEACDWSSCLVVLHEFTKLLIAVDRKLRIEHTQFIDYVLRSRLLQVANKLRSFHSRGGLVENRPVLLREVVNVSRNPGKRLCAQVARC